MEKQTLSAYLRRLSSLHCHEDKGFPAGSRYRQSNSFLLTISPFDISFFGDDTDPLKKYLSEVLPLIAKGPVYFWCVLEQTPTNLEKQHLHLVILEYTNLQYLHEGKKYRNQEVLMKLCTANNPNVNVRVHDSINKPIRYLCKGNKQGGPPHHIVSNHIDWSDDFIQQLHQQYYSQIGGGSSEDNLQKRGYSQFRNSGDVINNQDDEEGQFMGRKRSGKKKQLLQPSEPKVGLLYQLLKAHPEVTTFQQADKMILDVNSIHKNLATVYCQYNRLVARWLEDNIQQQYRNLNGTESLDRNKLDLLPKPPPVYIDLKVNHYGVQDWIDEVIPQYNFKEGGGGGVKKIKKIQEVRRQNIWLVGPPNVGKSTLLKILKRVFNCLVVPHDSIFWDFNPELDYQFLFIDEFSGELYGKNSRAFTAEKLKTFCDPKIGYKIECKNKPPITYSKHLPVVVTSNYRIEDLYKCRPQDLIALKQRFQEIFIDIEAPPLMMEGDQDDAVTGEDEEDQIIMIRKPTSSSPLLKKLCPKEKQKKKMRWEHNGKYHRHLNYILNYNNKVFTTKDIVPENTEFNTKPLFLIASPQDSIIEEEMKVEDKRDHHDNFGFVINNNMSNLNNLEEEQLQQGHYDFTQNNFISDLGVDDELEIDDLFNRQELAVGINTTTGLDDPEILSDKGHKYTSRAIQIFLKYLHFDQFEGSVDGLEEFCTLINQEFESGYIDNNIPDFLVGDFCTALQDLLDFQTKYYYE